MKFIASYILVLFLIGSIMSCTKDNAIDLSEVEEPVEDTISVNLCESEGLYLSEVEPIINLNCNSCHSSGGSADFILLDTHSDLVANSSTLMAAIKHDGGGVSVMPAGAPKLSDCDIQTIQKWIDSGKLNN